MRKILLLSFVLVMFAGIACAQKKQGKPNRAEMRKELRDFKLKFLAQEMDLKEDQQKRFFELYTQMSDEKEKLFKDTRDLERKVEKGENVTEEEYEAATNAITSARQKEADIDRKYDAKFVTFLTKKQVFKMKGAEEKFRRKMHEMRGKRKGMRNKSN